MKESMLTENTESGTITYKYIVHRPSKPRVALLSVAISLPNGCRQDLTNGFFDGNNMILSDELRARLILKAGEIEHGYHENHGRKAT